MQRILSSKEMQYCDNYTINVLGVSEEELVLRAGSSLAEEISNRYQGGRILFVIGKGNNGADGVVACKKLSLKHSFNVTILNDFNDLSILNSKFDIIVDCLFGTGLSRQIEGNYKELIEKINSSSAIKISCDIPSGINSDNGLVMGVSVKADITVVMQEYKYGHFLNDGPDYCGLLVKKDIGIAVFGDNYANLIEKQDVKELFPKRKRNINKGSCKKATVFGGSKKYFGSVLLSSLALSALKMGAGYSFLVVPDSLYGFYAGKNPEIIIKTIPDRNGELIFSANSLKDIINTDSLAFGMGVGVSDEVYNTIEYILKNFNGNLLLDADALGTISTFGLNVLKEKKCRVVITPHIKEFSRLINKDVNDVLSDSVSLAKEFAKEYGVIVVLKSAVTIITDGEELFINSSGNSALAKAGSGDVLIGITIGLMNRKESLLKICASASFLMGRAAEELSIKQNEYTVTATEIISELPSVINGLIY